MEFVQLLVHPILKRVDPSILQIQTQKNPGLLRSSFSAKGSSQHRGKLKSVVQKSDVALK